MAYELMENVNKNVVDFILRILQEDLTKILKILFIIIHKLIDFQIVIV